MFVPERVPFNRRTRRKLFDRTVPTLLSLFSGVQHWSKWPGQVLHIDLLKGSDLLSPDTCCMLHQSALHGCVDGLTAGPPCRTMSVLRMKEDRAPRQVRDKFGEGPFGKEGLSPAEQATVDDDTVLFLRTFLLMAVIQASSQVLQSLSHCSSWSSLQLQVITPRTQTIMFVVPLCKLAGSRKDLGIDRGWRAHDGSCLPEAYHSLCVIVAAA